MEYKRSTSTWLRDFPYRLPHPQKSPGLSMPASTIGRLIGQQHLTLVLLHTEACPSPLLQVPLGIVSVVADSCAIAQCGCIQAVLATATTACDSHYLPTAQTVLVLMATTGIHTRWPPTSRWAFPGFEVTLQRLPQLVTNCATKSASRFT